MSNFQEGSVRKVHVTKMVLALPNIAIKEIVISFPFLFTLAFKSEKEGQLLREQ